MAKNDARSWDKDRLNKARSEALGHLMDGMSVSKVAEKIGVSRHVVYKWKKINCETNGRLINDPEYRFKKNILIERTLEQLSSTQKGRPKGTLNLITQTQKAEIENLISNHFPNELGLPFFLWNIRSIQALINKQYKLEIGTSSVDRLLKSCWFISRKPVNPKWYNIALKDIGGLSLSEYANKHRMQLYYIGFCYKSSSCYEKILCLYFLTRSGHIDFLITDTSRKSEDMMYMFRKLKNNAHKKLLIAYKTCLFKNLHYVNTSPIFRANNPNLKLPKGIKLINVNFRVPSGKYLKSLK